VWPIAASSRNLGGARKRLAPAEARGEMGRRIAERYERAVDLWPRYGAARRQARGERLDTFCLATGSHRWYAPRFLRGRPRRARAPRARRYGLEFPAAVPVCWEATDCLVCQAAPALPSRPGPDLGTP